MANKETLNLEISTSLCCVRILRCLRVHPDLYLNINLNCLMYKLFLHDVHNSDLQLVSIIPDVVDAWEYFEIYFFFVMNMLLYVDSG